MDRICEDAARIVLSYLSPRDIEACAIACSSFRQVVFPISSKKHPNESNFWKVICERRWGAQTDLDNWRIKCLSSYRFLYELLWSWECLVGFWRGVDIAGNRLVTFEWRPDSIQGFVIVPASENSLNVRKIPFLWLGNSSNGRAVCLLHQPLVQADNCDLPTLEEDVFVDVNPEWDWAKLAELRLVQVELRVFEDNHFTIEEVQTWSSKLKQRQIFKKRTSLAEAAVSAAFGDASSSSTSPPGSFPYEMYQFMTNKVTSPGSDRAVQKLRSKQRIRAQSQGRKFIEPEHFVKVVDFNPTKARPFQGLWKGLCEYMGLEFILVSYDQNGDLNLRQVGNFLARRAESDSPRLEIGDVEMISATEFRLDINSEFSREFRLICSPHCNSYLLCDLVN